MRRAAAGFTPRREVELARRAPPCRRAVRAGGRPRTASTSEVEPGRPTRQRRGAGSRTPDAVTSRSCRCPLTTTGSVTPRPPLRRRARRSRRRRPGSSRARRRGRSGSRLPRTRSTRQRRVELALARPSGRRSPRGRQSTVATASIAPARAQQVADRRLGRGQRDARGALVRRRCAQRRGLRVVVQRSPGAVRVDERRRPRGSSPASSSARAIASAGAAAPPAAAPSCGWRRRRRPRPCSSASGTAAARSRVRVGLEHQDAARLRRATSRRGRCGRAGRGARRRRAAR